MAKYGGFAAGALFLLGGLSAFANSTAYDGYIQTSGKGSVSVADLAGGTVRIMITSAGQLNFRYSIGDQIFDSNPEAAVLDLSATSDSSIQSGASGDSQAYTANLTITPAAVAPYAARSYTTSFALFSSPDPDQFLTDLSLASAASASNSTKPRVDFRSGDLLLGGSLSAGSFDVSSLTSAFGPTSANTPAAAPSPDRFQFDPVLNFDAVPEPATFALAGGALLMGLLLHRRVAPSRP